MASAHHSGYWGNVAMAYRAVIAALVDLGRPHLAAVLAGFVEGAGVASTTKGYVSWPEVKERLTVLLGDQFEELFQRGRTLPKPELARMTVDEIDRHLGTTSTLSG